MNNLLSDFYCTNCGRKGIPIVRKVGQLREPGHLKKLFCIYCKQDVNHAEIKQSGEYTLKHFQAEKTFGNFNEDGNRKIPYRRFIGELKQRGEF